MDAQGKPFEEVLAAICDQAKMKLTIDPTPLEKGMLIPRVTFVASSCELGTALYWAARIGGMDFTLTKQGILAGRLSWLCKDRMLTKSYDIRELRKVVAPKVLQNGFIEFAESPAYEELLQKYSNIENFYEKGGPTVETVFTQKEGNVAITVTNLPEKHDDVARYLAAEREALRTTLDVSISTERVDPFIWRAELRKKLQAKITLKFDKTPISEAVAAVARASKIPLVIQHDGLEFTAIKHPDPPAVTQDFKDVTVEQALDTLLKPLKMKWELYKQVILVSQEGSNPFRGEMRIYVYANR